MSASIEILPEDRTATENVLHLLGEVTKSLDHIREAERVSFAKIKEEYERTQHMLLALGRRIEKLEEGVAAEEGER